MSRSRRPVLAAAALAVTALLTTGGLAACGGSSGSSSTSAGAPAAGSAGDAVAPGAAPLAGSDPDTVKREAAVAAPAAAPSASAAGAAASGGGAVTGTATQARVVRTVDVVVQVEHLDTSAARVRAIATSLGGTVANETTSYSGDPVTPKPVGGAAASSAPTVARPGESVLVLRVPVAQLDQAIARVTDPSLGKELSRTSTAQDVTADLADLGSRVKTQQASVDRVRQLLAKATSLQDIVLLEGELTRREADLEAFEARRASLSDQADLSTLTVTLRTPDVVTQPVDGIGFTAGLKRGWHALQASTTVLLTVLGALVPVAVVVAVVAGPLVWWRRRTRGARRTTVPSAGPGPAAPSTPPAAPSTPPAP